MRWSSCDNGHDEVRWKGEDPCWYCGGPARSSHRPTFIDRGHS